MRRINGGIFQRCLSDGILHGCQCIVRADSRQCNFAGWSTVGAPGGSTSCTCWFGTPPHCSPSTFANIRTIQPTIHLFTHSLTHSLTHSFIQQSPVIPIAFRLHRWPFRLRLVLQMGRIWLLQRAVISDPSVRCNYMAHRACHS